MTKIHKSGFVNIVGNPNVGKSTLMNRMVGERISIITSKMQTTRHRIFGIVNSDDFQIVYSDTPGIIKPNYKLQQRMMRFVSTALSDADVILYMTDTIESPEKNPEYLTKIQNIETPVITVINKIDLIQADEVKKLVEDWEERLPNTKVIAVSALEGAGTEKLFDLIIEALPEGPKWFPEDQLTDKSERFIVSEIIREKILNNYKKEIPYSVEVDVEAFKEDDKIIRISTIIYVERNSQKGILIGHQGKMLKKVGTEARKDAEAFFGKKVFLELFVKVRKDWRNNDRLLSGFGYQ
ncbi:MAG: GTPase Era [Bacteroidales bacterium]|nr:GTPase Era [Bacteroidales bacterium]